MLSWLLFFPLVAQAVGLGVTPSHWNIVLSDTQTPEQVFMVTNTTEDPLRYTFTVEGEADVSFVPSEWQLLPGEQQQVTATLISSNVDSFTLNVAAFALDQGNLGVATGIKIPVTVTAVTKYDLSNYYVWIIGLLALLLLLTVIGIVRKVDK